MRNLDIDKKIPAKKLFFSGALGAAKPDKKVFQAVEISLGLTGNEILYVGDHYESDILGSLQNDWQAIFYNVYAMEIENENVIQTQSYDQVYEYVKDLLS